MASRWLRGPIFRLALVCASVLGWVAPLHAASPIVSASPAGAELPLGQVVRRALQGDPAQEYLVYVPGRGGRGAPLFLTVHGISRNVDEHARLFAPYAERYGVVLVAPFFDRERHAGYQRLGQDPEGRGADRTLEAIVSEVRSLTGAVHGPFHLFGFSGGAQFAHRFVLAHPEHVAGAVVAAPGWYTFPDSVTPYPYGLGPGEEDPGVRMDPDRFLRVPITVLVGMQDTTGGESLRRNPSLDRQQGTTRRERARRWVAAMRQAARARGFVPRVTGEEVPGIGHSFGQFMRDGALGDRTFAALFGAPRPTEHPDAPSRVPAGAGVSGP